jgi:hypothetical protein
MRANCRVEQRAGCKTDHPDHARERKAETLGLATGLRIVRLVLGRIGHRDPGTVRQLDLAAAPAPARLRSHAHQPARRMRQRRHHRHRQAL